MKRMYPAVTLLLALTNFLLPAIGESQEILFGAKTDYVTLYGNAPTSTAVGDLNGDGKPDIVVTTYTVQSLSKVIGIFLNNGDGTFAPRVDYPMPENTHSVVIGDFNGDGKPDLVVGLINGSFYHGIYVLLGNGDGTFVTKGFYAGGNPWSMAVGDFNGDGKPDVVIANNYTSSGSVSVFLGNGDGTFAAAQTFATGAGPRSIAVGDFNGDSKLGLVVANSNSHTVSVLLGNGDGTLNAKVDYPAGSPPNAVAIGDFNGDGKLDLATADGYGAVDILIGNGDGTFATQKSYQTSYRTYPVSVTVGDFNGDGILDIATGQNSTSAVNSVIVLTGVGNGAFFKYTEYPVGNYPLAVATGDFNGDGKLDIVTANYNSNNISVLLNIAERSRVSGLLTLEGIAPSSSAQPVTFNFRSPGFDDFMPTLNIAPSGNFAVNLPKRSGVLHIKGSKYLGVNVNVDATGGNVSGITAILSAGDANNDNIVDIADFGIMVNAYNGDITVNGSGYDIRADFNGDGVVDIADFGLLVNSYNRQGDL